jgi:hypothetical protein
MVSTSGSSGIEINAAVANGDRECFQIAKDAAAGAAIELPRMPWADNRMLMKSSEGQRSATVRAVSLDGIENAVDVANRVPAAVYGDLSHVARRQLLHGTDVCRYHICS